jgi:uncharacterized OB-fold protein
MMNGSSKYQSGKKEEKNLTFVTCPKHGKRYPKGSTCPKCDEENRSTT